MTTSSTSSAPSRTPCRSRARQSASPCRITTRTAPRMKMPRRCQDRLPPGDFEAYWHRTGREQRLHGDGCQLPDTHRCRRDSGLVQHERPTFRDDLAGIPTKVPPTKRMMMASAPRHRSRSPSSRTQSANGFSPSPAKTTVRRRTSPATTQRHAPAGLTLPIPMPV
jgi:hypothetical protein